MKPSQLWKVFENSDLDFFTGVPDSTFKSWMSFLDDMHGKELTNVIACNECEAVALATGYHLATNKLPVVYMQNSGLGKTVNPLTSLCNPETFSIPMLLLVGWRGEPNKKDAHQHIKMGRITIQLLETLGIPYRLLPEDQSDAEDVVSELIGIAKETNYAVALVVRKGVVEQYSNVESIGSSFELTRNDAIKVIVDNLSGDETVVSTTGKTSRELFEYRVSKQQAPQDFYTVGSMGCSSSIALGAAMQKPEKKFVVFDGDGAAIMQMGAFATIGHYKPKNFVHIIFDNRCHESTGAQPTVSKTLSFEKIALGAGYNSARTVDNKEELVKHVKSLGEVTGPHLLVIKIKPGSSKDLGRPTFTPVQNKEFFMEHLEK